MSILSPGETLNDHTNNTVWPNNNGQVGPGDLRELSKTYYDKELIHIPNVSLYFTNGQQNLRNRVSAIVYYDYNDVSADFNGKAFSYDIHGNVKELVIFNKNYILSTP